MNNARYFLYFFVILLFLSSVFIMFFRLDSYPQGLYNWENYSVWRVFQRGYGELQPPFDNYLLLTQGLMTDSGLSPFVGIPVGFLFESFGVNLFSLRMWSAYLGIGTIMLFFFLTRKLFGFSVAVFSSIYLLFAPAFLLYSRTATNVGISLFFSLITFYLMYLVWKDPKKTQNYLFLLFSLLINSYLYGPIRFFLILTIVLFIGRLFFTLRKSLQANLRNVVFLLIVGLLGFFVFTKIAVINSTVALYFHGRGEQIFTKYAESKTLQEQGIAGIIPILTENTIHLGKLYLTINTKPAVTDYWNPQGQLITTFLVPFFLLGLGITIRRIKTPQYFLLLLWFLITSLPIIFTNNVHIGRLIFSLLPLFIFVGIGFAFLFTYFAKLFPSKKLLYLVIGSIVAISIFFEVSPYFSKQLPIDNYISRELLKEMGLGSTDVYLLNVNTESLRFWTAYFYLQSNYKFVDLENPEREPIGNKNADFTIYFIKEGATQDQITHFCKTNPLPVLLAGSFDPAFLNLPCKNRIIQI